MLWFKSSVEGAGLARFGWKYVFLAMIAASVFVGLIASEVFGVRVLGVFVAMGFFAFEMETLSMGAKMRRRELAKLWPEVVDSINSAVTAGMSLLEAIDDLALRGPKGLQAHFGRLSKNLDSGWSFSAAIDDLKVNLGEIHADRLCEVLRLVADSGSESLAGTLRRQSTNLRRDISLVGQLESKQGWVAGTAKIAVASPWIVVALLSMRPENLVIYNSTSGAMILLIGFVVSVFAYRLVQMMGALPKQPRVLAT
jgi:tight adherence protein B